MTLAVISFYTSDWKYPDYATNLKKDCERIGLPHHIECLPSRGDYVKNCNIKPEFIRNKLHQLKSPILWIDADGSLLKSPDLLLTSDIKNYDLAGNRWATNPERIHVGSIWFNYTELTLTFLDTWIDLVNSSIDDAAFNGVWNRFKQQLKLFSLPPEYFFIHKKDNYLIPNNTIILHRLSSSELKMQYKKKTKK